MTDLYPLFYELQKHLGEDAGDWPAQSKEEIVLGAILVQNTRWENVELTIQNLRQAYPDGYKTLHLEEVEHIQELIRPSGFQKNKSRAIQSVMAFLSEHGFDYEDIRERYGENLRDQLLQLFGVGQETADVLLLYVFDVPVFVADSYARRLFEAVGLGTYTNYQALRKAVGELPFSLRQAQQFHYYIDEFGKVAFAKGALFSDSALADFKLKTREA